jgi:hypothetical protein
MPVKRRALPPRVSFPDIYSQAQVQRLLTLADPEAPLGASLGQLDMRPFEFQGYFGNRRAVSFGFKYNFSRRSVENASDIPAFLGNLLVRVAKFAGYETDSFRQVGVNEYCPSAGIGWHKDKSEFGIIVGDSLLAPATIRFRRAHGANWIRISHALKPRSIHILSGEARTEWEHSISPLSNLRYSITFRTLSNTFPA